MGDAGGGKQPDPEWRAALFAAKRLYEARHRRPLTYDEIGARMARVMHRARPFSKQQVSGWFRGVEPGFRVGLALMLALEADPVAIAQLDVARLEAPDPVVADAETRAVDAEIALAEQAMREVHSEETAADRRERRDQRARES